jgi:hypothetical protein
MEYFRIWSVAIRTDPEGAPIVHGKHINFVLVLDYPDCIHASPLSEDHLKFYALTMGEKNG